MERPTESPTPRAGITRRSFLLAWAALPMGLALSSYAASPVLGPAPRPAPAVAAAMAAPASCVVTPQMTEGPYFVDERLNRSDIRANTSDGATKAGVPVSLSLQVSQLGADGCIPLVGATFDLWHCDALGTYSDVTDVGQGFATTGQDFLRGYQETDADGMARFTTIFPGWYTGRAVHMHFKVRTDPDAASGYEATSQFFFEDALIDRVHGLEPYAAKGPRDVRNAQDGIYQGGGEQTTLPLVQQDDGYAAQYQVVVDLSSPAPVAMPEGQPNTGPGGPGGGFGPPSGPPPAGGPGGRPPSGAPDGGRLGPAVQAPSVQMPR
jgi:protocatechuate 3,4-dioxygenase beta subunit